MQLVALPLVAIFILTFSFALTSMGKRGILSPQGACSFEILAGEQLLSVPFLRPALYRGNIVSVAGLELGFAGKIPADQYWLHLLEGPLAGTLVEIEMDGEGTGRIAETIPELETGDAVAVHPQFRMAALSECIGARELDRILCFGRHGELMMLEYYDDYGWYDLLLQEPADDYSIRPGQGFVLSTSVVRQGRWEGEVLTSPVRCSYPGNSAVALFGTLDPVGSCTLAQALPLPARYSLISFYRVNSGLFVPFCLAEFYPEYGWYDLLGNEEVGDRVLPAGQAVVLQSPASGEIQFPVHYQP